MLVYCDGVLLLPNHEYRMIDNDIVFNHPPQIGSKIFVDFNGYQQTFGCNGQTHVFRIDQEVQENVAITTLLQDCFKYKNNPVVLDALERLQVALSLVRD